MTPSRKEEFSMNGSLVISKTFDIRKTNLQYMVKTLKISDGPTQDYEYALKNSAVGATFHLKRHIYPYIRYFRPFENFNFRAYRLDHQCCPPVGVLAHPGGGLGQRVVLWLGHLITYGLAWLLVRRHPTTLGRPRRKQIVGLLIFMIRISQRCS